MKMKNMIRKARVCLGAALLTIGVVLGSGTVSSAATTKESEPNDQASAATSISVNTKVTGNLSSSNDVDYYKFTLKEYGSVSLTFSHKDADHTDSKVWGTYLYKGKVSNDSIFLSSTWKGGNADSISTDVYNLPAGTYYLEVYNYSYYNYENTEYGIKINYTSTADKNYEKEDNGTYRSATEISTNKKYKGRISGSDDVDYYKFTLKKRGSISLTFSHEDTEHQDSKVWGTYLYKDKVSNDSIFLSSTWKGGKADSASTDVYILPEGTYYLEVYNYSYYNYENTEYGVKINFTSMAGTDSEKEDNGTYRSATDISVNKVYKGRISGSDDEDYYKFTLKEKGSISLIFSHEDAGHSDSKVWGTYLYKDKVSNDSLLYDNTWKGGNATSDSTDLYNVPAGTYYLKVYNYSYYNYENVEYGIKITYMSEKLSTMYRLYNPNSGEHFYTADKKERDYLASIGWNYEGEAWKAPTVSGTPVYRLYNPNAGDHHYTTSEAERDMLMSVGWNYEGIGWYSDDAKRQPLYRLYNPNATQAGAHHYTTDKKERDMLKQIGWNYEGIGWYGGK